MSKDIEWNSLPENVIAQHSDTVWVVRTGVVATKTKKQKQFEDSHVLMFSLEGEGNSVLGYVLQLKKAFPLYFNKGSYVSFFSDVTSPHKDPKVMFKDQKVYLYRFNGTKSPSYWFLFRSRAT